MSLVQKIKEATAKAIEDKYGVPTVADDILVNLTKPEFEGEYTVVLFSLIKQLKRSPEQLGKEIGEQLVAGNTELFTGFNVIKGFLNLSVRDAYFLEFLSKEPADTYMGSVAAKEKSDR
jgi:arginyl-tRNA synthetase